METKSWTTIDKSDWGDGPWMQEPDKMQWQDPETGLPCLVVRALVTGALCGYVGVTRDHPAYEKDYTRLDVDLDVHGGLTFADKCQPDAEEKGICHIPGEGEPDDVWWLGFDCSHAGDFCPAMEALHRRIGVPSFEAQLPAELRELYKRHSDVYAALPYVQMQVYELAKQLKAMANA